VSKTIRTHLRRNVISYVALLVFALVCWLALGAGEASASHVSCGDKIRADTTLHRDLDNCRNNGLVIAADDVTLDLNGHTIDGDGELVKRCRRDLCDVGVVNDGHDDVTVMHGSVREFAVGAFVVKARHNRVLDLSASRNLFFGIGFFESARSTVRDSSVFRNGLDTDLEGISMFRSDHNRILHNSLRHNGDVGLFMAKSDHNQIRKNSARRNREGGIASEGVGNVFSRNRVFRGGAGIQITGFGRHGRAVGNVVRRNQVRGSGANAISVDPIVKRTLISRNHVIGSARDGINILSDSTTLLRNRAVRNGDLGIEAVEGVIDGGGNRASGNGDPRQCVNVTCH
jgi:parallel beta-helix repeat protein